MIKEKSSGFTLAEILIAVSILGIVITTVYGSLHSVLPQVAAIEEGISAYEMAENCINRIITDLQAIYVTPKLQYVPPEFTNPPDLFRVEGDTSPAGDGDLARLRFTSLAHVSFEEDLRQGIASIVYYILETEGGDYDLRRSDTLQLDEDFEENWGDPILCRQVKTFTLTYYDHEGETYDTWDSDSSENGYATPKAIGIKLEIGDNASSYQFETAITLPAYRDEKENT